MPQFLSRTPILIVSFIGTLLVMLSFGPVQEAAGTPLLDFLMSGAAANERLAAMTGEAKTAHFWGTVLNDTAYPLTYGALFAGLAFRFGSPKLVYGLPALAGVLLDLAENTIQALALSDTANLLFLKTVLTPLKFTMVAAAAGLALILMLRALLQKMRA
ncbi:MAG: hypothetical protein AAF296_01425 [Pseudomonadota bacterium]